jgi:hypothetical protein
MVSPRSGARIEHGRETAQQPTDGDGRLRIPARGQVLLTTYCFCAVVLAWVVDTSRRIDRPIGFFTADPASALSAERCSWDCSYAGVVSNLGALGWAATAATCFLVAALLARIAGAPPRRSPFLWAGVVTTALLVDDLFMVHEFLYFRGVPELAVFALLGAGVVAYLVAFRSFLLRTDFSLLVVAGALFLVSVVVDALTSGQHLIEDGPKFVAIMTWAVYFGGTGVAAARAALEQDGAPLPRDGRAARA